MYDLSFYKNRKVFVTGHTGFKGSWLCQILVEAGAIVTGYSLLPPTQPNLFALSRVQSKMDSIIGDIRDFDRLQQAFIEAQPEIVFHLAAQPIVRESYKNPRDTYDINVMGTVNILECIRQSNSAKSFLNVTTDKVYYNNEWTYSYREIDSLDGFDPYSNSKSCSELVTHSYKNSFFMNGSVAISTARAGNVIGGGDFASDRIIPDCVRAAIMGDCITIRNPNSIRPYQHVLEPLFVYLLIAQKQFENQTFANYYNVGPNDNDCITTGELVQMFCTAWGKGQTWKYKSEENAQHEANTLKLDCSRLKVSLGWKPHWDIAQAIEKTICWTKAWINGEDISSEMNNEIKSFMEDNYGLLGK